MIRFLFLTLLILGGAGCYLMSAEDRARFLRLAIEFLRNVKAGVDRGHEELKPYYDTLKTRTRWVIVTPAFAAINTVVFLGMLFGAGSFSDPATLVAWGGSYGPRTTNGEWWRLVTANFAHSGLLHLLVNLIGLVQLGLLLERFVGYFSFAGVYLAAGVLAGLVGLSAHPMTASVGSGGAIAGLYGLLLASLILGWIQRWPMTISLRALRRLGPAAIVYALYTMASSTIDMPAVEAGFVVGFACGIIFSVRVSDQKPPARRIAAAVTATAVIAVSSAVPLRGVNDVRPEIARLITVEDRLTATYDTARTRFKSGRASADALTQLIDKTIMPELHATYARLKAVEGVPREHRPLVASAEEYFRLRDESWRLRTDGLKKADLKALQKADQREREALQAIEKLRMTEDKDTSNAE